MMKVKVLIVVLMEEEEARSEKKWKQTHTHTYTHTHTTITTRLLQTSWGKPEQEPNHNLQHNNVGHKAGLLETYPGVNTR